MRVLAKNGGSCGGRTCDSLLKSTMHHLLTRVEVGAELLKDIDIQGKTC